MFNEKTLHKEGYCVTVEEMNTRRYNVIEEAKGHFSVKYFSKTCP